jgi:DNA modification methylase
MPEPFYQDASCTIYNGDCREILPLLDAESFVSVVTDPPYGLSFMGKKWDYEVPSVAIWEAVFAALKPGGHLLSFAGTRTQHRMAVNIEDAGFEIRDMIAWVYGSGFPKSLDVSKAIDKMDATDARRDRQLRFTEWMRASCRIGADEANRLMGTQSEAGHYFTSGQQPHIATREYFEKLRPHFSCDVPEWVEQLVNERTVESENFKRREVVGKATGSNHADGSKSCFSVGSEMKKVEIDITVPHTEAARQWSGYGSALKPALEPITMARKPLDGTLAANTLRHGCGGINVDGCRVGTEVLPEAIAGQAKLGTFERGVMLTPERTGRWPANLVHDGSDEVVGLFPETTSGGGDKTNKDIRGDAVGGIYGTYKPNPSPKQHSIDSGSAARFFYCAKASDREILPAEEHPLFKESYAAVNNTHPTVKPVDLMRWLIRLVTPPGGVLLEPFMGSGTTLMAARLEGRRAVGIEINPEYCEIAANRLRQSVFAFDEVCV